MKAAEERRSPHVQRVPLVALVEICQAAGEGSGPFQAHCANVSGRGMQVRTGYLPELEEELVCRFEHDGHEILVEGRVAWRSEGADGGEFGIQFTALDADSADILRHLGRPQAPVGGSGDAHEGEQHSASGGKHRLELAQGQRVRLHMDGLGAPMKASVHVGGDRRIRVGSGLEFLKVGRSLEVEEVEGGTRQAARVDSVNVIINPQTSVPELVVQLRYEGISETPPPAKAEPTRAESSAVAGKYAQRGREGDGSSDALAPDLADDPADDLADEGTWGSADAFSERLSGLMERLGKVAHRAGAQVGGVLSVVTAQASAAAERSRSRPRRAPQTGEPVEGARARKRTQGTRRAVGGAPSHLRSGIHDLNMTGQARPSRRPSASPAEVAPTKGTRRRLGAVVLAMTVILGSAATLRALGTGQQVAAPEKQVAPTAEKSGEAPVSPQAGPPSAVSVRSEPSVTPEGIVADVPLFGQRTVATDAGTGDQEESIDLEQAEKLAAAAAVPDEKWDDVPVAAQKAVAEEPWGRGRLHLPTIHRIRLDGEGAKLSGAAEPNGFVVVIPGRRAMESGRAIQKRDKRIASVAASNTDEGAKMRFQFRGPVPPYRVRLRKDFVEFLISAPEEGVAGL